MIIPRLYQAYGVAVDPILSIRLHIGSPCVLVKAPQTECSQQCLIAGAAKLWKLFQRVCRECIGSLTPFIKTKTAAKIVHTLLAYEAVC